MWQYIACISQIECFDLAGCLHMCHATCSKGFGDESVDMDHNVEYECLSQAVVEIQRRLPNARILYVSATGATEAENLCYMTRLGLWGDQTAFANKQEFVNMLTTQGVGKL